ncbi:hypothetical protein AVEN_132944-1 [Araneus ventricosus]|uniref:Uncharacterized protein n=1 Tax=Araneus ventricosus TaxID=182803 RepID=A0A4Y2KNE7_ARAVE|nr:hypothetical protein AVEN_132944-1 [Araneus ventricosus]
MNLVDLVQFNSDPSICHTIVFSRRKLKGLLAYRIIALCDFPLSHRQYPYSSPFHYHLKHSLPSGTFSSSAAAIKGGIEIESTKYPNEMMAEEEILENSDRRMQNLHVVSNAHQWLRTCFTMLCVMHGCCLCDQRKLPTRVPYHPFNYRMAAGVFIRVVSKYGKVTMRYWIKPLTAPPGGKRWS